MGDRCYSTITCAKRDKEHFEALGYHVQGKGEAFIDGELHPITGAVFMVDEQANYGNCEELRGLAEKKHLPFLVQSGPGDAYGNYVSASDGKTFVEHDCLYDSAYPAIRVGPDGVRGDELREATRYWQIYDSAVRAILDRTKEAVPCNRSSRSGRRKRRSSSASRSRKSTGRATSRTSPASAK